MAQKSIPGSPELANKIKKRRNELNLAIEEAALRAGVGTKTWSRYEAGESIRVDKCKGICKALNWRDFSDYEGDESEKSFAEEYKDHEAWSQPLADEYGDTAAAAFAAGSDILLDHIQEDLSDLASLPAGSHIGQLNTSFICDDLPPQFLTRYDYDFLYHLKCTLLQLRQRAKFGSSMTAHSVMEELAIYLSNKEAQFLIELDDDYDSEDLDDWVFDLFGDSDIEITLYSDRYLSEDHIYHFTHWGEERFFTGR